MSKDIFRRVVVGAVLLMMGVGVIGTALQPLFLTKGDGAGASIPFVVEPSTASGSTEPVEMSNPLPPLGSQSHQPEFERQAEATAPRVKDTPECQALLTSAREVLNGKGEPGAKQARLSSLHRQAILENCF